MIDDSKKLRILVSILLFVSFLLAYYNTYLIMKQIHATDYMWFVFGFMVLFSMIVALTRSVVDESKIKIKNLEDRVDILEKELRK